MNINVDEIVIEIKENTCDVRQEDHDLFANETNKTNETNKMK